MDPAEEAQPATQPAEGAAVTGEGRGPKGDSRGRSCPSPVAKDVPGRGVTPNGGDPLPAEMRTAKYSADDPTPQGLAEWAAQNQDKDRLEIELARDLDLAVRDGDPGLRFKAAKKILRAKDPASPPTIRLTYLGAAVRQDQPPWRP